MNALKLDFDSRTPPSDLLDRIRALFRWLGGRPAVVGVWRSNSKGWHVLVETRARWAVDPVTVVAAQAILGSDAKREMFNLMRAIGLSKRPLFWRRRHRWNIFYSRKLQGGANQMGKDTMIEFKSGSPKLTPDIIGADAAVLTIQEFKRGQKTRIGEADVLVFAEFPGHGWYANTTSLKAIASVYGPDYSLWKGKKVPLEARDSTIVGSSKATKTLWCAGAVSANDPFDRALWDKALKLAKRVSRK